MDKDTEESIRAEIADIKRIPLRERGEQVWTRLNALESEIRRRHPELQSGEFPSILFPFYFKNYPSFFFFRTINYYLF